ncbi:hypothetical protein COO60DRAFT_549962 [Scenedesmus sp. NREL 46B-D3]|nr:hypothetical protein COO60DRAFT_549962 [Scenedesmus sp. NREL 46B-D3]
MITAVLPSSLMLQLNIESRVADDQPKLLFGVVQQHGEPIAITFNGQLDLKYCTSSQLLFWIFLLHCRTLCMLQCQHLIGNACIAVMQALALRSRSYRNTHRTSHAALAVAALSSNLHRCCCCYATIVSAFAVTNMIAQHAPGAAPGASESFHVECMTNMRSALEYVCPSTLITSLQSMQPADVATYMRAKAEEFASQAIVCKFRIGVVGGMAAFFQMRLVANDGREPAGPASAEQLVQECGGDAEAVKGHEVGKVLGPWLAMCSVEAVGQTAIRNSKRP